MCFSPTRALDFKVVGCVTLWALGDRLLLLLDSVVCYGELRNFCAFRRIVHIANAHAERNEEAGPCYYHPHEDENKNDGQQDKRGARSAEAPVDVFKYALGPESTTHTTSNRPSAERLANREPPYRIAHGFAECNVICGPSLRTFTDGRICAGALDNSIGWVGCWGGC